MRRTDGAKDQRIDQRRRARPVPRACLASLGLVARSTLSVVGCGDAGGGQAPGEPVNGEGEEVRTAPEAIVAPTGVTLRRGVFGTVQDTQLARTITKPAAIDALANARYGARERAAIAVNVMASHRRWVEIDRAVRSGAGGASTPRSPLRKASTGTETPGPPQTHTSSRGLNGEKQP